ncbi:MAG TPA: thioredoxin family protein [Tepidisphaeraceae bacterium]|nr:thioredoxin family protein [Tepidisphaeraceae bacterium]
MQASFLADKFATALDYDQYLRTGTDEQRRRWKQVYDATSLTPRQIEVVNSFSRQMKLLAISGIWCGDCVQQLPLIERICEANPAKLWLRIVDRDEHRDLADLVRINAGDRVPMVLFLAEDHEICAVFGDRTLARYRALAAKYLGAEACSTAIFLPPQEELAATLADWLNEIERVQWMLRLSARLRKLHGD